MPEKPAYRVLPWWPVPDDETLRAAGTADATKTKGDGS